MKMQKKSHMKKGKINGRIEALKAYIPKKKLLKLNKKTKQIKNKFCIFQHTENIYFYKIYKRFYREMFFFLEMIAHTSFLYERRTISRKLYLMIIFLYIKIPKCYFF